MKNRKKIAWFDTHPIQYNTPAYSRINEDKEIEQIVYYFSDFSIRKYFDNQFDTHLKWDIPLLKGYKYKFLKNFSKKEHGSIFSYLNLGIFSEIRKNRYDLVITNGWGSISHILVFISCVITSTPYSVRGDSNSHMVNKSKILQFLTRKLIFSYAKTIFYIGKQNKKFYKMHGVREKKLIRMPLCVNNKFFIEQKSYINIDKEKKLLKINDEKVILISSKLIHKKSIDTLIYALENISTPYVLLIAGSGKLEKNLKNLCQKLKINARFLGFINQSQIPKYYWISDIFVMTSKREPWGLSTNEAMNCDCAIILSNRVGAKDDLVKDNGFVFKTNSVEDLKLKIEALINNKEMLNKFKENSKEIIKNFDYQTNSEAIKEFFNKEDNKEQKHV